MTYVRFGLLAEIPPGASKSLRIGTRHIAVFNVGGTLHAIEDACAHMKAPLSGGRLRGSEVTCARHGWSFDVRTGLRVGGDWGSVRTFDVKVDGGTVLVSPDPRPAAVAPEDEEGLDGPAA